jgi:hypothetical protein
LTHHIQPLVEYRKSLLSGRHLHRVDGSNTFKAKAAAALAGVASEPAVAPF